MPEIDRLNTIQFESSSACNAACRFCTHPDMTRKGRMTEELFHSIVEQGIDMGVLHYYPFFLSEPLADVRLRDWMNYLDERVASFSIFTNAQLLTPETADWLLRAPNIQTLWISFYGVTKEVYETAMQGLSFEISSANVDYAIALFEQLGESGESRPEHLFVRMSEYEDNAGQVAAFKERFGSYAAVRRHVNWAGDRPSSYARMDLPQWPCSRIMDQMYITFEGKVVLCCLDGHGKVVLGDANTEPLRDVWKRAQGIRDAHRAFDFDFHLCRTCSLNRSAYDPWKGLYQRPEGR